MIKHMCFIVVKQAVYLLSPAKVDCKKNWLILEVDEEHMIVTGCVISTGEIFSCMMSKEEYELIKDATELPDKSKNLLLSQ